MSFERVARLSVTGGRAEPGTNPKSQALPFCGKIRLPEETNMRKLIVLSAAALLAGALAGGVHATPLSATGAMAMSGVADQSMPDQGVIKARWHQRHYGWSRGYHYGWRHHHSSRYANYRGSRNFQDKFSVER
jgi:hypothetical protein